MTLRQAVPACLLLVLAFTACKEADPLAERLAQRTHYQVDVVGFSPREGGRLLVELEARAGMGEHLRQLTATIRQHGEGEEILASDRVTLDLAEMDATGVVRVYTDVDAFEGVIQGVSALVEHAPTPAEYDQFPEILEVTTP